MLREAVAACDAGPVSVDWRSTQRGSMVGTTFMDEVQPTGTEGKKHLSVLVVEDDADARTTLEELIGLLGHQAIGAADAAQALHDVSHNDLDIALIDIGLPTMDGCEVARRIRAKGRGVPRLVALTGFSDLHTREAAKSAGFDDFIVKPVMPDHLERLLSRVNPNVKP